MKKSFTLIATAAVAFSMLASTALAENVKTTSDYKDLTSIDAGLKSKIDTLLAKGIFEGVSSDTFGISQNMTRAQFAKVASLVFGLKVDTSIQTSSFTDVLATDPANGWAIPYIEAAKKAGLIDGMTDTTFAPGDKVTVGQLDTVLLKGLGHKVNTSASPWYADAVKQATELSIHPLDKKGDSDATRADLAVGAYASLPSSPTQQSPVSVSTVQASGDQTVQVTLDKEVDTSKATWSLSKNGTDIPVTTTWSSDKKSASLALSSDTKLSTGTYTVTLGGLDSSSILTASGTLTVGTTAATGDLRFTLPESYELSNVIDSGIAESTTGLSKTEAEDPTISKFAKEIVFTVNKASGEEVSAPGIIQSITSSNPSIVKAAVSSEHKGYILGNKVGTATINIVYSTLDGNFKQVTIPVHVKSDYSVAESIKARDSAFIQYVTVTNGVYSAQFNAFEKMDMIVTDNYGSEYEGAELSTYNTALGIVVIPQDIVGDPSSGAVGTVLIDPNGTVHVNGNVTKFTITAITSKGTQVSADVTVLKQ
ncbi:MULTISPECIES: S-layer homology domain-containing protein [unclassified Paenibacillus]|uniref:S-layer homology domain-containing protein n=1 Tax=unclassified Paenibacillus TaxID=185978 RepID=UPI00363D41D0